MKAQLILENGTRFTGTMFGYKATVVGEMVFAAGMTGYQEMLTDPSLAGHIVTMTFPLIGNYGINLEDNESPCTHLKALIVREKCNTPSNFRNEMNLEDFMEEKGVVGLEGIDTRALTKILRDNGSMKGVIAIGEPSDAEVKAIMDAFDNTKLIDEVTAKKVYEQNPGGKTHVAFIDLGTRESIKNSLINQNCKLTVFPANVSADEIQAVNPDAVFVSNGPDVPFAAKKTVETIKALVGKYPIFGICTGHHIIALALGCKVEKLKFGRHCGGHPVREIKTGKVYIASQSQDYVVSECGDDIEQTFVNVNDKTCEGICHKTLPIQSVQFPPSGDESDLSIEMLFGRFLKEVK